MPHDIPSLRILPMSHKTKGFENLSIQDVQQTYFLRRLPARHGRFLYATTGLNADPGTLVLFQFRAHAIASATFLRDEKFTRPRDGHAGTLHFDPASFQTFDPLNADAMRKIWPAFRAFGHVKQYLNPTLYTTFKRRLKNVATPDHPTH